MKFQDIQNCFKEFGYRLDRGKFINNYKYRAYRKNGLFGVLYSNSIKIILKGVERHFDSIK